MADTPEQARIRAQLQGRGNQLAPRVNPSTGNAEPANARARQGSQPRPQRAKKASYKAATDIATVVAPETRAATGARRAGGAGARGRTGGAGGAGQRGQRGQRGSSSRGRRASKQAFGTLTGREGGGILIAEFLAGAFIIAFTLFTEGPSAGYTTVMPRIMLRLSALTGVFFVLFLVAGSQRAGKAAVWFGLLVDLAIVLNAYRNSFFTTLTDIVQDKGTGVETATLTASTNVPEPTPAVQLPNE